MLFNSYGFIFLYLPLVLIGFFQWARWRRDAAAAWLAAASLFFYGYWNPVYVGLLLVSIVGNYWFGRRIADTGKKSVLVLAIGVDLALLAYYKYANFFLDSVNSLAGTHWSLGTIILPLGISFFTFTQIAFLVDTYQGKVKEYNFIHYVLFVTYFPHLIAGPVLHHKDMMPQFARPATYQVNWLNVATGILLFTVGLFKKVYWADALAPYVAGIFDGAAHATPTIYEAWCGALAYTLQIYFDFSGYTDMALGIALMFNIHLPTNFNSPYKASSIIDFWRRWHITLSTFLRDYLYIPLGGNRHGKLRRYGNLFATMLLGGLWHGAGWTFVIWGALHGAYLTVNHLWREHVAAHVPRLPLGLGKLLGGALTFVAVVVAWVLFRAENVATALALLKAMFGIAYQPVTLAEVGAGKLLLLTDLSGRELVKLLLPGLLWVWLLPNSLRVRFLSRHLLLTLLQTGLALYLLFQILDQFGNYSPFLYFQF